MMQFLKIPIPSDFIGASASALCLVHCLATPFLFVAQTCASTGCCEAYGPGWWSNLDYLFVGITFLAVFFSARKTSKSWMPIALYGSWFVLSLLVINEKLELTALHEGYKYTAAFGLISIHLYNRKYCRCVYDKCCVS